MLCRRWDSARLAYDQLPADPEGERSSRSSRRRAASGAHVSISGAPDAWCQLCADRERPTSAFARRYPQPGCAEASIWRLHEPDRLKG